MLDVAVRAFNEFGYDATSMGTLADRLGLSKSAIYHHFPSKDHLLEAALDEALGGLEGVLAEPAAVTGAPSARLQHVLRRAVEVLVERLPYVTLLLRLRGNTDVERAGAGPSPRVRPRGQRAGRRRHGMPASCVPTSTRGSPSACSSA